MESKHTKPTENQISPEAALAEIERLRAELAAEKQARSEPIAVVGLGCRFPGGANTPEAYWELLQQGRDAVTEIPASRWDVDRFYDPTPNTPGKIYVREGSFLSGDNGPNVERFDPHFFKMSPREAAGLDPQQRLLLEVSWEALEYGGIAADDLQGSRTGVFTGFFWDDYSAQRLYAAEPEQIDRYQTLSNLHGLAAGRLAHTLGLHGPVMPVDTACSSSLLAVHLACQSLQLGECDLALAGGVYLLLSPEIVLGLCRMQAVSADGRSKTFDADADGFGQGEGCGMVVLKRLSDAVRNGDMILATILGSVVNHDGRSRTVTTPNGLAQQAMLRQALDKAGVTANQIQYVETHGTGTVFGDPIEVLALGKVLGQDRETPLFIGSVKTNFGHLSAAAGVASLIKVILSLQHAEIPPNLHFSTPNPHIPWSEMPLTVPTEPTPWSGQPKMAGVSSFGMSGTNVHLIVSDDLIVSDALPQAARHTALPASTAEPPLHLLTLSAKTDAALTALAERYEDHLATTDQRLADICYTAQTGRSHFSHRLAVTAETRTQAQEHLTAFRAGQSSKSVSHSQVKGRRSPKRSPKIAFLFTGQGAQYVDMGRELYETQPTFRRTLERCDQILQPLLNRSLLEIIYPDQDQPASVSTLLDETATTQPALFALEYALATLWRAWGIEPDVVIGHSVGEYVAACIAGVFSLEDGLKLVAERGRLMQALPRYGKMIAVLADEERVREALAGYSDQVSLAAINAPQSVVISGAEQAVQQVVDSLTEAGIKTRPLTVSHAFHSPLMEPMLAEFEQVARQITLSAPQIPLVSNLTGQPAAEDVTSPDYWTRHIREPVRFAAGLATIHEQGIEIFVEIGPKPTLSGLGKQNLPAETLAWLPSLRSGKSDWQQLLESLAALYVRGVDIDWSRFNQVEAVAAMGQPSSPNGRRKVVLPRYPFQRQSYWNDAPSRKREADAAGSWRPLRPLIDKMIQSPLHQATIFETEFSLNRLPFLSDHQVYGEVISPATCQLAMALSGVDLANGSQTYTLVDVVFPQPLIISPNEARTVQLVVSEPSQGDDAGSSGALQLISFAENEGQSDGQSPATHLTGRLMAQAEQSTKRVSLEEIRARCREGLGAHDLYKTAEQQQISLGPHFRWIGQVWRGDGEVLGQLTLPEIIDNAADYPLHPGLLDGCFQIAGLTWADEDSPETLLPFALERMRYYQPIGGQTWWCYAQQAGEHQWNLQLLGPTGQVIAELIGFKVRAALPQMTPMEDASAPWDDSLYSVVWQARPLFGLPPGYLPRPEQLQKQMKADLNTLLTQPDMRHYQKAQIALERLSLDYVLAALVKMGFTFQPGVGGRTDEMAAQLKIIPHYHRLFARLLQMLAEAGILEQVGDTWQVIDSPVIRDLQQQQADLSTQYAAVAEAELIMLGRCGEKLVEVLQGTQEPLDLLFPGGDNSLATRLYHDAPESGAMNSLMQKSMKSILAQLPAGRGIRILEIGGGTGSTAAHLLPHLPPDRTEYVFTDNNPVFTARAKEKFAAYDFIHYQTLNIEKSPATQGFDPHRYDIVVATNVLHATQDLGETFAHVQRLLAPGGMLMMLEGTVPQRWVDLTFGLTDGWWRFADMRQDYPLLSASEWRDFLTDSGFQAVALMPEPSAADLQLKQSVIIAQRGESVAAQPGKWLVLAESRELGYALTSRLQAQGEACLLMTADPEAVSLSPNVAEAVPDMIILNRDQPEELPQRLQETLHLAESAWRGVVYLGEPVMTGEQSKDVPELALQLCDNVLHLVQAVTQIDQPPRLWLVTADSQVLETEDHGSRLDGQRNGVDPRLTGLKVAQGGLWGLGQTIAAEYPQLHCTCVDLANESVANQAQTLLDELQASDQESQIAYRQGVRYGARFARWQGDNLSERHEITAEAGYLIVGGLGALGLQIAQQLVDDGARHLVLSGRRGVTVEETKQTIARLEAAGAVVQVVPADISKVAEVERLLAACDGLAPLRGIIQAAGTLDDGVLAQQSRLRFKKVMAPKVWGTWHLHTLTQALPLDFFVCFSSAVSFFNVPGQGNHAAASTFVDTLMAQRRQLGLPGLSIKWGPWADIGQAAKISRQAQQRWSNQGIATLSPQQGRRIFSHLLTQRGGQVGVVPVQWADFLRVNNPAPSFFEQFADQFVAATSLPLTAPAGIVEQLTAASATERRTRLIDHLRGQVIQVVGLSSEIDFTPQHPLFDLGLDSLTALELKNHLETGLGISLHATLLFDYPTIESLAEHLLLKLFDEEPKAVAEDSDAELERAILDEIDHLSDEELAAVIDAELTDLLSDE